MFDFDPNSLLRLASLVPYAGSSADENQLPANDSEAKKKNSFTPSTVAQDRLNELMQQMPQYQQPNLFTKIVAGMMGASSGPQTAMNYLNQPYQREMQGWKNQVGVAENAARDENTTNQIGRQLAYNQSQTQDREQKMQNDLDIASTKAKNYETRLGILQQNADTSKAKLDIARASAMGHQIEFQKDGTAIIVHNDGTSVPVTGVDGSTPAIFTPQDMQQMKDEAALARTNATQAGENFRMQNKPGVNSKGAHVSRVVQAPDGTMMGVMSDGSVQPLKDIPIGSTNVAGAPTTTTNTQTTMDEPGTLGKLVGMQPSVKTQKTTTTTKTPVTTIGQTVHMQSPDGKTYSVDQKDVAEATKHGWKVIGG